MLISDIWSVLVDWVLGCLYFDILNYYKSLHLFA